MDFIKNHFAVFKNKIFMRSLIFSFLALVVAVFVNYYASLYANKMASSSVTDVFLSNFPVVDVDGFFIFGPVLFWIFVFIVSLNYIKRIPFLIYSISIFVIIRAIFVCLTHLGPFPTQALVTGSSIFHTFSVGNDFFFSGHTGLPFLVALVFWDIIPMRIISLLTSIFFGMIVLLGHYHYSIDVLSAFFITYSIYKIAEIFFKKEKSFYQLQ